MLTKKHFQILAKAFTYQFSFEQTQSQEFEEKLEFFMNVLARTNSQFDREIFKNFVYKNL